MKRGFVFIACVFLAVVLTGQGCASRPTARTEKVPGVDEPSSTQPQAGEKQPPSFATASQPPQSVSSKPVSVLLARADSELDAGNLDQSAANLERALRIAPQDAHIWHKLAKVCLHQGEAEQAEAMAKKSNTLVAADDPLWSRNWRVIAEARRLRGDTDGASRAERRAQTHGPGR